MTAMQEKIFITMYCTSSHNFVPSAVKMTFLFLSQLEIHCKLRNLNLQKHKNQFFSLQLQRFCVMHYPELCSLNTGNDFHKEVHRQYIILAFSYFALAQNPYCKDCNTAFVKNSAV